MYLYTLLIGALLVIGAWLSQEVTRKDEEYGEVLAALSGTEEERYEEALLKAEEGDLEEARVIMGRLARLGDSADAPAVHGKAHLWMAKDKLEHFEVDAIRSFPLADSEDRPGVVLGEGDADVALAQRHLEHAVDISPELEAAWEWRAAVFAALGKRNDAVGVLLDAVTHGQSPHPGLAGGR